MKRKILFAASGIVLALGAVFGAKAMHKKFDTSLFFKIGMGSCTPITCTTITTHPECVTSPAVLYTTSLCSTPYTGPAHFAE